MYGEPRFLLAGDAALVVEFGDEISPEVNHRVHVLAHALEQNPFPGLGEAVPTYRSLLVHYDPLCLSFEEAKTFVLDVLGKCEEIPLPEPRLVEIPTVYGGEFGPDTEFVAEHNGLSVEEVVRLHSGATYTVYMLGFTPGFTYLGGLPEALATPRLPTPRKLVPAGSVGIAGSQTGMYAITTPGGWRLIGRTPATLFDPARIPPTLLRPGDRVRFVPISAEEFHTLMEGAKSGA
ncbi:MAG: allophanate hydrolase [Chloroflexi bacterium]|nr:MAG: allophanate hydrolase [Chloroflexota bacterium]RLC91106.1 MAG: allophanate hydrolase [Chloroflexota bacterium]